MKPDLENLRAVLINNGRYFVLEQGKTVEQLAAFLNLVVDVMIEEGWEISASLRDERAAVNVWMRIEDPAVTPADCIRLVNFAAAVQLLHQHAPEILEELGFTLGPAEGSVH